MKPEHKKALREKAHSDRKFREHLLRNPKEAARIHLNIELSDEEHKQITDGAGAIEKHARELEELLKKTEGMKAALFPVIFGI
jgi:hypothetical protein